ncbi:MAG TPA: 2-oxoglutarate dehydrogenase E1 component [Gammaproteobacteria bacterium]|nr:2-oxoglutarate dehydrogenase E1 component [Gammaproteobacteria bacterium]
MKESWQYSYLINGDDYIEELYELFLRDPESVSKDWQKYFQSLGIETVSHEQIREEFIALAKQKNNAVMVSSNVGLESDIAYLYRTRGHVHAKLDPLNLALPRVDAVLPDDKKLQEIYCGSIGAEYMHITNQTEVQWIQDRLENPANRQPLTLEKQKRILACLTAADGLEKYLGTKYVGQKRFSLEGGDSLIPLLDEIVQRSATQSVKEIVIGMAHRGRLNVLMNILGKAPKDLFDEFEGKADNHGRTGDVKYHMGFSSDIKTLAGSLHLALAFNPSHLEIVSPVTIGSVRARQKRYGLEKRQEILGIQIHGDAAFAGQGVVMETFALSQTRGFGTGGTIHIVVNNQVGFTTDPRDARSSYYCTDIAKMVEAPIFHVNGDDPEAVFFVAQLAIDYRMKFAKDIVIDLICYRRHGHNESDEPAATQPVMYQVIKQHATPREIYADKLIQLGKIKKEDADYLITNYRDSLDQGKNPLPEVISQHINQQGEDWTPYLDKSFDLKSNTAVKIDVLKKLATEINTIPSGMTLQPQVAKTNEDNKKMAKGEIPMNWGFAENLAYATLLNDGYNVRMSGQDCGRGTFAHRHAVLHDFQNGNIYVPLEHVSQKATFSIFDSILSEEAVVAFEYGYATNTPSTLVLWEAQFGDFVNGSQVVIDQFISSGEQKWGRLSGLVMLLPHGQEGMGPEHSSARLERFLQSCAQDNMQVCMPSTPAQLFHMLRRQMVRPVRKPLIVMTPKSLLRHKLVTSTLEDLSQGFFQKIIPESDPLKTADITRVIFCTGKVYYTLLEARRAQKINSIALVRVEELYPFPKEDIKKLLSENYANIKDIVWCQEEPKNQGAWTYLKGKFKKLLNPTQVLRYVGPLSAAAPALGSNKLHVAQQQQIITDALQGNAK